MIMLDRWEALGSDTQFDKHTVEVCQELAAEMCSEIFSRMGLDVQTIANALRVSGRGLTYLFPTRDKAITTKSLDPPRIRLPAPLKPAHKGRPRKKFTGASADD